QETNPGRRPPRAGEDRSISRCIPRMRRLSCFVRLVGGFRPLDPLDDIGMAVGDGAHLQAHGGELLMAQGLVLEIAARAGVVDLCGADDLPEEAVEPADPALRIVLPARVLLGTVGGDLRGGWHQWNLSTGTA